MRAYAAAMTSKKNPTTRQPATAPPSVAESWARIDEWFRAHPEFQPRLRAPATEEQIAAAESVLGTRFPEDFRASLRIHDGQDDEPDCQWLPVAHRLGSLASLVACWKDDRENYEEEEDAEGEDRGRVFAVFDHPAHLPIAGSKYWDYDRLLIDLNPGPKGKSGQIIAREDIELRFVAPSFAHLLADVAAKIDQKNAVTRSG